MKVFIAGLSTETNSFSPLPTGLKSFEEGKIHRGTATADPIEFWTSPLHIWKKNSLANNWDVVESLSAHAQPAGLTIRSVYETFRDEILEDLRNAGSVDIILLSLHGAMIADGYDDCEGDLINRCRELCPNAVIGGLLDPHCHLTELMMQAADLLMPYKEYPHVDIPERAEDLFRLAKETALGNITPVMRDFDCRMILALPTPSGPMREFVDSMIAREGKDGILSLSIAHGFPWGDHERTGTRALAICDGNADQAQKIATELGTQLYEMRHQLLAENITIDQALDLAEAEVAGPVVLADMSDNAGGGAPSDSTFLLEAILGRGMTSVAIGVFWDPGTVRICQEAGVGAKLAVRLGGKCGPMSGKPLDLMVTVRACMLNAQQMFGTLPTPMGEAVWLECEGVDIVVNTVRTQTFHPQAFEQLGINLSERKYICVKSSNHYQAGFNPIAKKVIPIATPGAITPDFANIPYQNRQPDYWPKVEDPFA